MLRKHIRLLSCLAREINYNQYEIKIQLPIENILNKKKYVLLKVQVIFV